MIEDDVSDMEGELLNILDKKTIKRVILAALAGICVVLFLMLGIMARLHTFNSIERQQELDKDGEYLYVETLISDGWVKEMPEDFVYPSQFDPASFSCYNERGVNTSYKAGMNWHIAKPIKVDELISALTEILKEQMKTGEKL